MFKSNNLNQLLQLSQEMSKKLDVEMRIFDETFNETIRNAPDEDKAAVEELKGLSQKAIALAKEGKVNEANKIINDYQNGRKSNR